MSARVLTGRWGGTATTPPSGSGQGGGPNNPQQLYRQYFNAFFNPALNPFIGQNYTGSDFEGDFQSYLRSSLGATRRSVRFGTYNERATLIKGMGAETILGYLQGCVRMALDPVDVTALTLLFHDAAFISKAGQAIYKNREFYGIDLPEGATVGEVRVKDGPSAEERAGLEAHLKVCAMCRYRMEATTTLLARHAQVTYKRLVDAYAARLKGSPLLVRRDVPAFARFSLKDPVQVLGVFEFLHARAKESFDGNFNAALDSYLEGTD